MSRMTAQEMIYLARAICLATEAHSGQLDKGGEPYINHPMRVMMDIPAGNGAAKITAVLHDVIEDTAVTLCDLIDAKFPSDVIAAVDILTHDKRDPYEDYIVQVGKNPVAAMVKLYDLKDNMDITRLPELTDRDVGRLWKYHRAYFYLRDGY